jgi:hypothetical protein
MNRARAKPKPALARKKTPKPKRQKRADSTAGAQAENPKLKALLRAHFTKKGRVTRIARARKALEEFRFDVDLDMETIKWVAEDPDLEYR